MGIISDGYKIFFDFSLALRADRFQLINNCCRHLKHVKRKSRLLCFRRVCSLNPSDSWDPHRRHPPQVPLFTGFFANGTWIEHRCHEEVIVSWLPLFSYYFWIYFPRNAFPPYLRTLNFVESKMPIRYDPSRIKKKLPLPSVGSVCEATRAATRAMPRSTETSLHFFIQ